MRPRQLLSLLFAACCGCFSTVTSSQIGAVLEPRPTDCELDLDTGGKVSRQRYDHVGLITITFRSLDDLSSEDRRKIREQACAMGGTLLTLNSAAGGSGPIAGSLQFMVWAPKRRQRSAPQKF